MNMNCCSTTPPSTAAGEAHSIASNRQELPCRNLLDELVAQSLQKLLQDALEAEADEFIAKYWEVRDDQGRRRFVRNGYVPARIIQTQIGTVKIAAPRIRDLRRNVSFSSMLLPRYSRRLQKFEEYGKSLLLYGLSKGDFLDALHLILGEGATALTDGITTRLRDRWSKDIAQRTSRILSGISYSCIQAECISLSERYAEQKPCLLLLLGATTSGDLDLLDISTANSESEQAWIEILTDLRRRGLDKLPIDISQSCGNLRSAIIRTGL
jgi:transposase-like protein